MSGEQQYEPVGQTTQAYTIDARVGPIDRVRNLYECQGCGSVVTDPTLHDRWHNKTRSIP